MNETKAPRRGRPAKTAPQSLQEWGSGVRSTNRGYQGGPRSMRKPADQRRQRGFVITGHCSQAINDAGIRSALSPSEVIEALFTTHAAEVKSLLSKS